MVITSRDSSKRKPLREPEESLRRNLNKILKRSQGYELRKKYLLQLLPPVGTPIITPPAIGMRSSSDTEATAFYILTEFCTCIVDRIMPPRRLKKKSVKRLVEKRVAKAIEEYEKTRANPGNASGSGSTNTGGTVNVQGCTHKTFMNGKPHPFNGTEGVVGLRRWIEKIEQVFEICKCAEEDKVMFAASTFEGRALTWWNGNVHTLGLVNANHIPWTEFKSMMTTEYCPATEIQRME
ncbi:hypothetical protein Tco_0428215, partial [Tanacetum coccineum]